jgi:hypothetical protein
MKSHFKATIIASILLLMVIALGCGDEKSNVPSLGSMTATINDTSWKSWPNFANASRNSGETEVECYGEGLLGLDTCEIALYFGYPAEGTIELGGDTNDTNYCVVTTYNNSNVVDYSTYNIKGTGTAVITSITGDRIKGTFSFLAYTWDEADSVIVTNGTFDLPIFDI